MHPFPHLSLHLSIESVCVCGGGNAPIGILTRAVMETVEFVRCLGGTRFHFKLGATTTNRNKHLNLTLCGSLVVFVSEQQTFHNCSMKKSLNAPQTDKRNNYPKKLQTERGIVLLSVVTLWQLNI